MNNENFATPSSFSALDEDDLIDAHPQAELIRLVQRTAYRAYSRRHKQGLDALSWLMGPMAMFGFGMVDDHRDDQSRQCMEAVQELITSIGDSVEDRRVIAVLLQGYPGRNPFIKDMLMGHLGLVGS